jgi:hypothetical protein
MNPNQIEIKNVFVRPQGQLATDDTLRVGDANEIVLQWEAGAVANAGGANVTFQIEVWNITNGTAAPLVLPWSPVAPNGAGANTTYEQIQPLPPGSLAPNVNCVNEIHACLHVAPNVVSFAKSPAFFVFQ